MSPLFFSEDDELTPQQEVTRRRIRFVIRSVTRPFEWIRALYRFLVFTICEPVLREPIQFLRLWFTSRNWKTFLLASPGLLVATLFLFIGHAGQTVQQGDIIQDYRRAADQALARGETKTAELWLSKVAALQPDAPDLRFRLALTAVKHGDVGRARRIAASLAPDDEVGYGPAHLWMANDLIANPSRLAAGGRNGQEPGDEDRPIQIRHHLTAALASDPGNITVREQLARLEIQRRDIPAAIEQLQQLVRRDRRYSLALAQLHASQGQIALARRVADGGLRYYRDKVRRNADDVTSRIHNAALEAFLENFENATGLLLAGLPRKPQKENNDDLDRLQRQLGKSFFDWSVHVKRTNPQDFTLRLKLLQKGLQFAPNNGPILEHLAELTRSDTLESREALDSLSDALVQGAATPLVHLILGVAALERKDFKREVHHLKLALAADPRLTIAANNLAWRLANSDPPRLDEALQLVQQALQHCPEASPFYPAMRDTRGHIYRLMQRRDEAILDLEYAIGRGHSSAGSNEALAKLYENAGSADLARRHRAQAARLKKLGKP